MSWRRVVVMGPHLGDPEPVPPGVVEFHFPGGGVCLGFDGPAACYERALGWYYGYPPCCVEFFATAVETAQRERRPTWGDPPDFPPHHPESGHLLCPVCRNGSPAPLPDRPADRFGWITWYVDEPEPRGGAT